MAVSKKIEWTHCTWNPVTGCSKVSKGCANCYAERMAERLHGMGSPRYKNGFTVTLHHDLVDRPRRWRKPRVIFANSMSDMFHEEVPLEFIRRIFQTMADTPQHAYQILTKRSARLAELAPKLPWPNNVWMGVTVENKQYYHRIDHLRQTPATVKFLSCEPLLGPLVGIDLDGVDWVIAGGESGPGARPMEEAWVLELLQTCRAHSVPFFFKQWGGFNRRATGRSLGGKLYEEVPRALRRTHPQLRLSL